MHVLEAATQVMAVSQLELDNAKRSQAYLVVAPQEFWLHLNCLLEYVQRAGMAWQALSRSWAAHGFVKVHLLSPFTL